MVVVVDARLWELFRRHWRQTMTYWSVFFSFGLCVAFLGPTILELGCQTRSSLRQVSWVFFVQQLFLLLGSALGGLFKKTLVFSLSSLFSSALIISLVFALIPLCHNVALLAVAMAIAGTAMGVIDTIANLQLVKLYQKDSAVFLQVLHFFIGLGALVSPLVADPFLSEGGCNLTSNGTLSAHSTGPQYVSLSGETLGVHNTSRYPLHTEGLASSQVCYAFWIMALINLPVPLVVFLLMYHERLLPCLRTSPRLLDRDHSVLSRSAPVSSEDQHSLFRCCNLSKLRGRPSSFYLLHVLGGAVLFITDGIIGAYAAFVYTYAVSPPLEMAHKMAGCLDSVFWAAVTAGRLAFVYLSYRFSAARLLIFSLLGVVTVQCMLLMLYYSSVFLFIGTCALGLCISSVFPCVLAFTEDTLDYKGCATTVLVTSASAGEMVLQVLVGSVMDSRGSYAFLVCGTIVSIMGFGLFLLLQYVCHLHSDSHQEPSKDFSMTDMPSSGGH
ncbi:unnamed protein product [Merluccius merluccius]